MWSRNILKEKKKRWCIWNTRRRFGNAIKTSLASYTCKRYTNTMPYQNYKRKEGKGFRIKRPKKEPCKRREKTRKKVTYDMNRSNKGKLTCFYFFYMHITNSANGTGGTTNVVTFFYTNAEGFTGSGWTGATTIEQTRVFRPNYLVLSIKLNGFCTTRYHFTYAVLFITRDYDVVTNQRQKFCTGRMGRHKAITIFTANETNTEYFIDSQACINANFFRRIESFVGRKFPWYGIWSISKYLIQIERLRISIFHPTTYTFIRTNISIKLTNFLIFIYIYCIRFSYMRI